MDWERRYSVKRLMLSRHFQFIRSTWSFEPQSDGFMHTRLLAFETLLLIFHLLVNPYVIGLKKRGKAGLFRCSVKLFVAVHHHDIICCTSCIMLRYRSASWYSAYLHWSFHPGRLSTTYCCARISSSNRRSCTFHDRKLVARNSRTVG